MKHFLIRNKTTHMKLKYNKRNVIVTAFMGLFSTISSQAAVESDLLVGYTRAASANRGGNDQIVAQIRQGIIRMNNANRNSRTDVTVVERSIAEFSIEENGRDLIDMLTEWRNRRGGTSEGVSQRDLEERLGVDLSCIVSVGGGVRGVAFLNNPYSAVIVSQARLHTLGHEVGHNYNAVHDQGSELVASSSNSLSGNRYTFMASGGRSNGSIVDHYSNPDVSYQGAVTGTRDRNNARRLFDQRNVRANFRSRPANPRPPAPRPPAAPTPPTNPGGGIVPGDDFQELQFRHSNRCVDNQGSTRRRTSYIQWRCRSHVNGSFRFERRGGGFWRIRSQRSNLCIDMTGTSRNRGEIVQWPCNNHRNQQWRIVQRGGSTSPWFWLQARVGRRCMNQSGVSLANRGPIEQFACRDLDWQWLRFR